MVFVRHKGWKRKGEKPFWISVRELLNPDGDGIPRYQSLLIGHAVPQKNAYPKWNGIYVNRGLGPRLEKTLDITSPSLWYLVGLYMKSGLVSRNTCTGATAVPYKRLSFSVPVTKADEIEEALSSAYSPKRKPRNQNSEVISFELYGGELCMFLSRFGQKMKLRTVPADTFRLPSALLQNLVAGFMQLPPSALYDNTEGERQIVVTKASLALSLLLIIEKATGIVPYISTRDVSIKRIFGDRVVEMSDYHTIRFCLAPRRSPSHYIADGYSWSAIRSITTSKPKEMYRIIGTEGLEMTVSGISICSVTQA